MHLNKCKRPTCLGKVDFKLKANLVILNRPNSIALLEENSQCCHLRSKDLTQGCSSVTADVTRAGILFASRSTFRSEARFPFLLLEAERDSSFPACLIRSSAPHHCLFLPVTTSKSPAASADVWGQSSCLSRDPLAASSVTSDGSIALQDNTVWNGIQNPTRKEKIKSTEQAFLKEGSHQKKKNKKQQHQKTELL